MPISSSGHLVLFQKIFGITENVLTFDIMLHIATIIAVVWVLRKEILGLIKKPFSKEVRYLIIATIPAVIAGLTLTDLIDKVFKSGSTLGFEFILTGMILLFADKIHGKKQIASMTARDATIIGIGQAIAILPAISRSGTTLAAGLFAGLNRETALKFSFILSIPVIFGAALLDIMRGNLTVSLILSPVYIVGMLSATFFGILAIRFMLNVFSKQSLKPFAIYVFILGGLVIIDQFLTHIFL